MDTSYFLELHIWCKRFLQRKPWIILFSISKCLCYRFLQRKPWILLNRTVKRESSDLSITASLIMDTYGTMELCLRYSKQLAFDLEQAWKKVKKLFALAHIIFLLWEAWCLIVKYAQLQIGQRHCVKLVFLSKTHVSLHYYKWAPANLMRGVTLHWTSIPSLEVEVQIFLVASCYRNWRYM